MTSRKTIEHSANWIVFNKLSFIFYHGEIFYVKDITDKKVASQNQEVEGHIAGYRLQRKPPYHELKYYTVLSWSWNSIIS